MIKQLDRSISLKLKSLILEININIRYFYSFFLFEVGKTKRTLKINDAKLFKLPEEPKRNVGFVRRTTPPRHTKVAIASKIYQDSFRKT